MNLGTQFDKKARANFAGVRRHVFWGHIHLTLFWTWATQETFIFLFYGLNLIKRVVANLPYKPCLTPCW